MGKDPTSKCGPMAELRGAKHPAMNGGKPSRNPTTANGCIRVRCKEMFD
jgi:hypothetical protein